MDTYKLYAYDVWGNEKEGYEVNNVYSALVGTNLFDAVSVEVELPPDASDRDIIKSIKDSGWLNKKLHYKSFEVEGDFDYTLYLSYKGRPLGELRKIS